MNNLNYAKIKIRQFRKELPDFLFLSLTCGQRGAEDGRPLQFLY